MSSIDVIIPCYKYAHYLKECVDSVLAGGVPDVRVLIIDDTSPDNTPEVAQALVKADSRVQYIRHPVNKRHIATYNEGIEWTRSDYLLLLSADDYLLPGALRRAAEVLDAHPEVAFVYGRAISSPDSGIRNPPDAASTPPAAPTIMTGLEFIQLIEACKTANFVATPTAVIRTQVQKAAGGYRPELPHSGDLEMWLRLAAYGSVGSLDTYQAVYRCHGKNMNLDYSVAKKGLPDLLQRKDALDWFYRSCKTRLPRPRHIHRRLLKQLGCEFLELAKMAFKEGDLPTTRQLLRLAADADPKQKKTGDWKKLAPEFFFWPRQVKALDDKWPFYFHCHQHYVKVRHRLGNAVRKMRRLSGV